MKINKLACTNTHISITQKVTNTSLHTEIHKYTLFMTLPIPDSIEKYTHFENEASLRFALEFWLNYYLRYLTILHDKIMKSAPCKENIDLLFQQT